MLCESEREEKKLRKKNQVPLVWGLFLLLVFNSNMLKIEQNGNSFLFYYIDFLIYKEKKHTLNKEFLSRATSVIGQSLI